MLLYTLKHPKYLLVIWLPSSPHTRRKSRHCSSGFEKKIMSSYTFPPLSCPTSPSVRSFQATEKVKTIHSSVDCKDLLISGGFKETLILQLPL